MPLARQALGQENLQERLIGHIAPIREYLRSSIIETGACS
jgi:hypothetical protein